ncbi:hypothetical protein [Martelella alba]|uniref:Uncharacterized protein n=1 Tax=Martelella alba TaxID=2590451 RepID=A0ABY2SHG2_9HYPH|nr:hypothetical protein [Martelella alba]TKI04474.1 hypothetical protein FCN80_17780 [Martelella alba]
MFSETDYIWKVKRRGLFPRYVVAPFMFLISSGKWLDDSSLRIFKKNIIKHMDRHYYRIGCQKIINEILLEIMTKSVMGCEQNPSFRAGRDDRRAGGMPDSLFVTIQHD